jgi:uncharacterized membrane protein YqhA
MTEPDRDPTVGELLRATKPWWLVPVVLLLVAALVLVFTDVVPLRDLAYAVM